MSKHRGSIAEMGRAINKSFVGALFLRAYAEEPSGQAPDNDKGGSGGDNTAATGTLNYEDLIAKARTEEKQKQYGAIERLKTQVSSLTQQHNDDLLKIAELEKKLTETEAKLTTAGKGDSEAVTTLRAELDTEKQARTKAEKDLKDLQKNTVSREELEKEIRADLEKEYEVKSYKVEQLAAHPEILVPELVMGETKEAIDASIQAAVTRSAAIRKSLGLPETPAAGNTPAAQNDQQNNPLAALMGGVPNQPQTPNTGVPGAGRTPKSPNSPSIDMSQDAATLMSRLASVDVASDEYKQIRKQLGLDKM